MADGQVTGEAFGFGSGSGFQTGADGIPGRGGRDPHFMQVDDGKGATDVWKEYENHFAILPPFANYIERYTQIQNEARAANKEPEFPFGNQYFRLNVKTHRDRNPRAYRVPWDNPLTQAFSQLYQGLCGGSGSFSDELKAISKHMGGLTPECRCVLNILLANHTSGIKWFDAPSDPKGKVSDDASKKKLTARIGELFNTYTPRMPRKLPLFDLDENLVLSLYVAFGGSSERPIPQWGQVKVVEDGGQLKVVNVRSILEKSVEGWSEDMLNEAEEWTKGFDDLPDLKDIPNLMANGRACEILGLGTGQAQAPGQVHSSVAPPTEQSAPPPQEDAVGEADKEGSVGGAFSTFDKDGDAAAEAFKRSVTEPSSPQQPPAQPPQQQALQPDTPPEDEPPF